MRNTSMGAGKHKEGTNVRGTENGSIPVGHQEVLGIVQTVGAGLYNGKSQSELRDARGRLLGVASEGRGSSTCSKTLLALLKLLKEAEVAWNLCAHVESCVGIARLGFGVVVKGRLVDTAM